MFAWISRFLPVHTLEEVGPEGAHVRLEIVVVSPDLLTSPIAPTRAAAIQWSLLESCTVSTGQGTTEQRLRALTTGWRGEALRVRSASGKTIEIPLGGVRLTTPVDPEDGTPVGSRAVADVYGAAIARTRATGMLYLRERPIACGETLELAAFVTAAPPRSEGYREAGLAQPHADFRAIRDVRLTDID